jgi:hypothetical protein
MRRPLFPIIVLLFAAHAAPVWAVIVFEKGKAQPIVGYLQRQDDERVVVRQLLPDGQTRLRELLRSEIDDILIAVSNERLESLRPDRPAGYRDYAEELAEKRKDPDARVTGLRLYLIAAYLDSEKLGRSSLLGMVGLARTPSEQRRFRAMAFLLDPKHDRSLLQGSAKTTGPAAKVDDEGQDVLLKAVRAFRRGERRTAMILAGRPVVQKAFARFSDVLTHEEFTSIGKEVPPDILRKVLTLELILSGRETAAGDQSADDSAPWSRIVEREGTAPVPSLSLERLTEFDPRECIFREGKWVRPPQEPHRPIVGAGR